MNILICGDFSPVGKLLDLFEKKLFEQVLGDVKPVVEKNDYSIVNFETCVAKSGDTPIKKYGPNLCCTARAIDALKWAGFNCVTLANNHFRDFGKNGVLQTIDAIKKADMDYVGGGKNFEEASNILFKQVYNETIAIINVCEHEFSIAIGENEGSNPIDVIRVYQDIQDAKKKADYVLVIVHGGHEHFQLPSLRMQKTYRFFIDVGADAVVNHHQHCFSGFETYKRKPIFYGIGNFCFDNFSKDKNRESPWYFGYMVHLFFSKEKIDFEIFPYSQCEKSLSIRLLEKNAFDRKIESLNEIIANSNKLKAECDKFYQEKHIIYEMAFEPYKGKIARKLFKMGLLPRFLTKEESLYQLINIIECESHRDRVLQILKGKI